MSPAPAGLTVWLTGLPGAGKTTSASYLIEALRGEGRATALLDGDLLRAGISSDLGFSAADRDENVRRAGELALLLATQVDVVVVSLVSPRRVARDAVRARHAEVGVGYLEVHVAAPLEVCEARDPKSLYRRARLGEVAHMTGVDDPYEPPLAPDAVLATDVCDAKETGEQLVKVVREVLGSGR
jgi:bifunctional enzyme CysN/CysC